MGIRGSKKLNNKGTSLIEIIVSILILAIIFVPLLKVFTDSMRANKIAKEHFYAETAADNVMEAVKAFGEDRTQLSGYFTGAVFEAEGTATGDKRSYVIKGLREGTSEYDVRLVFDAGDYTTDGSNPAVVLPNDYKFADMSAFSAEGSIMVFPGIGGLDFDDTAISAFYEDNSNYMGLLWQTAYNNSYDGWSENYTGWINAGAAGEMPEFNAPDQSLFAGLTVAELKSLISRKIALVIEETPVLTSYTDELGVNRTKTSYSYKVSSKIEYTLDNDTPLFNSGNGICADPAEYPEWVKSYTGYCSDNGYDSLDSIFLIYNPFSDSAAAGAAEIHFERESVSIRSVSSTDKDIFIVVQTTADNPDFSKDRLKVNVSNNGGGKINLFSQANLDTAGMVATADNVHSSVLKDMKDTLRRIYKVNISVYDTDANLTGEPLISVSSTVLKK